ncbi:hypothetical protein C8F04DRAFT_1401872 [Mycena alexandri]|uniref:Uncharacterized protein n=1 Tax=Mycena alexandri TaxID=1745969 RepID=A0AAD6SAK6_9AGAR|nr:hypothetical protein C8F04DRAFT_1401872 [Mycena alexandri]
MTPTPVRQIARELVICTSLSFIVILGVIHALLHLLQASIISGATIQSPVGKFFATPAVRIAQISQLHSYVLVIFKVTIACTILVLAVREAVSSLGIWIGWWTPEGQLEADLESGDLKSDVDWSADEKVPYSDAPYPNETVFIL